MSKSGAEEGAGAQAERKGKKRERPLVVVDQVGSGQQSVPSATQCEH